MSQRTPGCCRLVAALGAALLVLLPAAAPGQEEKKAEKKETKPAKFEPIDVDGMLLDTDPPDQMLQGPCRLHRVDFKRGRSYQIDLASTDFDSYLRLEDAAGKELTRDDDSGGALNARIIFTPLADGSYQIVATSLNRAPGKYKLRVVDRGEVVLAAPKALVLGKNGVKVGDNLGLNDPRDAKRANAAAKVYSVKLQAGKNYQIDMQSGAFDSYLRLEDNTGAALAEDDDGGGFPHARIVFNCQQNGDYRIVATQFVPGQGDFTLEVREK